MNRTEGTLPSEPATAESITLWRISTKLDAEPKSAADDIVVAPRVKKLQSLKEKDQSLKEKCLSLETKSQGLKEKRQSLKEKRQSLKTKSRSLKE